MRILITGGAGSIGSHLVKALILDDPTNAIAVIDNNEYALAQLRMDVNNHRVKLFMGDIRDKKRLCSILDYIKKSWRFGFLDVILHLAAMKRVETTNYNIEEAIKINVSGTMTLINTCKQHLQPRKFLLISSDKAVPTRDGDIGFYGATKFLQERIVLANNLPILCSVARFGNVMGTRGDVFEIWKHQRKQGKPLTITDRRMKRFYWSIDEAVSFILNCLKIMKGGEIFVPHMNEYCIMDLAKKTFGSNVKMKEVGIRLGEVLQHKLMTDSEKLRATETDWGWIIQ